MTPEQAKTFIREMFTNVFDMNSNKSTYDKYFSKNYLQYVDGKTLNYNEFIEHMAALKSVLRSTSFAFKYIVAEGDIVATVHVARGIKKNGDVVEAQVNALFIIKEGKIVLCDELTHMIKGSETDKDLGSRK